MIERAAVCLKTGGEHFLRIPRGNFRSRRALHSAFWSHGAGDINLPAWWLAFLQVPPLYGSPWSSEETATTASRAPPEGLGLGLLDFLYPKRTLAFIRKCVHGKPTAVRRQRRSQLLLQRCRAYTSAADGRGSVPLDQDKGGQEISADDPGEKEDVRSSSATPDEIECKVKLQTILHSTEHHTSRALWQAYQQLMETSLLLDPGDIVRFFELLSTSTQAFELERTMDLFNDVPQSRRRALHYKYAISAALKMQNLPSAMAMHREAASRIQGSFGSSIIFKYAVQKSKWRAAEAIWKDYWAHKQVYFGEADLWECIETLPVSEQIEKATNAVKNAIQRIEASSFDDAEPMRSLAISLVLRALNARGSEFSASLQFRMLELAQHIQQADLALFKAAVLQNLSVGYKHRAMASKLYRQIRNETNLVPDLELLKAMSESFSFSRDSQGMHEVLEDYRNHHGGLPEESYSPLMAQFARHGDYTTVDELFQEFIAKHGNQKIQDHARCLLFACFRRAEAERADSVLQSLRETYGYEPDLEVWNILLATYARIGDRDRTMALFQRLVESNILPDSSTYEILMGMFARRSDLEATGDLYERAASAGIQPSLRMVDSLVLALTSSDRFDEAYQLVEEALTTHFDEKPTSFAEQPNRTRMWNTLLSHCGINGRLDKVWDLQKRMREAQVPFDTNTYAALMLILCIKKMPGAALRIMNVVMPKAGARATALHYSVVMGGFLQTNEPQTVLRLGNEMLEKGISPTFSTNNTLLRTASRVDKQEDNQEMPEDHPFEARRAEQVLGQVLENLDPKELAPFGPVQRAQSNPANVAFYASYFPYMIYLYGKKQSYDRVVTMYDTYVSTAKQVQPGAGADPPVELLSALMIAHTNAGEHLETEKCWRLAWEKAKRIACKANAKTSQPGWVLQKYRFLLALPLTRYMQSLQETSRVDEIVSVVNSLQFAGYQLSVFNWNKYIQVLAQEGRSMPAFEYCEKQLMDGWPGWDRFGHHVRAKLKIKTQWNPKSWELGRPFPHYETFVHLARVYLDIKGLPYGTSRALLQDLERVAPRAMEGVLKMPNLDDEIQNRLLRRD
ncbi:MAG: hypothetical protein L6R40_003246 [Gallowayella cf. fulva]|nr:MAG: hypothetical protein L6R40_003246 [Xanthomendoza cf. fulva]